MSVYQYKIKSPLGHLYLVASDCGLQGVHWEKQSLPDTKKLDSVKAKAYVLEAEKQLTEYFANKRKQFSLTLDLVGTDFQLKVWQALLKVPYGDTASYKSIAQSIKNPKAFRAVGNANGKNPLCIIIPCHRVLAADGTIGGYSGGLNKKKKLLAVENISYR